MRPAHDGQSAFCPISKSASVFGLLTLHPPMPGPPYSGWHVSQIDGGGTGRFPLRRRHTQGSDRRDVPQRRCPRSW